MKKTVNHNNNNNKMKKYTKKIDKTQKGGFWNFKLQDLNILNKLITFKPTSKKELIARIHEFYKANYQNDDINSWNVSQITDMSGLFKEFQGFNKNIENWDVSNVTNMNEMFSGCGYFNQSLNNWDVSKVTTMERMFYKCDSFNQSLNDWNVSNVTNMKEMFRFCDAFNQPLNKWDVSNVTNMNSMFFRCDNYNQPMNDWNVSKVTDMGYMFQSNRKLNHAIDKWDVSNVTNMAGMFCWSYFNGSINNWDVSNVTNMRAMFFENQFFVQPLNNWNVSKVTDMAYMFYNTSFNHPLNNWNVSNVTDMCEMFAYNHDINQPLNNWDVSNVTNMTRMFYRCITFNQPLNDWNTKNVLLYDGIFSLKIDGIKLNIYPNRMEQKNKPIFENRMNDVTSFDFDAWNIKNQQIIIKIISKIGLIKYTNSEKTFSLYLFEWLKSILKDVKTKNNKKTIESLNVKLNKIKKMLLLIKSTHTDFLYTISKFVIIQNYDFKLNYIKHYIEHCYDAHQNNLDSIYEMYHDPKYTSEQRIFEEKIVFELANAGFKIENEITDDLTLFIDDELTMESVKATVLNIIKDEVHYLKLKSMNSDSKKKNYILNCLKEKLKLFNKTNKLNEHVFKYISSIVITLKKTN